MGLIAIVRPVITYDYLLDSSPLKKEIVSGTNFVVYRELTGGIYFGEKSISDDRRSAYDTCFYNIFNALMAVSWCTTVRWHSSTTWP